MTDTALQTSLRQAREATIREHVDAENRHDPDATVATFSDSKASYDIPPFGDVGQVPDHDAIRELFVGMFSVFLDFHIEAGPLRHGDDHVFVEVRFTALKPPTGQVFLRQVSHSVRAWAYYSSLKAMNSRVNASIWTSVKSPVSSGLPAESPCG